LSSPGRLHYLIPFSTPPGRINKYIDSKIVFRILPKIKLS